VDGGAAANDLLLQMQADLLQTSLVRPKVLETTALGAAYLAGLATGVWSGPEDLQSPPQADRVFEPVRSSDEAAASRAGWQKAVARAKGWAA
jgi:glycerol kinase